MNPPLPLAWRDAMAAVPHGTFTQAEAAAGWPQALTPAQLARLQRPYTTHKDRIAYRACQALEQTIAEGVASGALPHTVQQHSTPESWKERMSLFDVYDRDRPAGSDAWERVPAKAWQTHHIAPADARAWLAAQGETPSPHVAAWFAGAGLQPAQVGAPAAVAAQPAPAKEHRILRKRELVKELSGNWPSIAKDLNEGKAAAARRGRGLYDVDATTAWAKQNGRWKDRSESSNVVPLEQAWNGKTTTHRMRG